MATLSSILGATYTGNAGPQGIQGIQGDQGIQGIQGIQGDQGLTGPGVAAGGSAGQILAKASSTDFDTAWTNPPESGISTGKAIAMAIVFG